MPMQGQKVGTCKAPTHSQPGNRRWSVVSAIPRSLYPRERAGNQVGFGVGLDGTENLASTGIRSPDRPVSSESLYRLSYVPKAEPATAV
jgi:hypothetical protein